MTAFAVMGLNASVTVYYITSSVAMTMSITGITVVWVRQEREMTKPANQVDRVKLLCRKHTGTYTEGWWSSAMSMQAHTQGVSV